MIEVNLEKVRLKGKKYIILAEMATLIHSMLKDENFEKEDIVDHIVKAFLDDKEIELLASARFGAINGEMPS